MSTVDVAALREAAERATPGPWSSGGVWWEHWTDPEGRLCHTPWPTVTHGSTGADVTAKTTREADAAFIAAANPSVVLALLDRVEAAEGAVERIAAIRTHNGTPISPANLRWAATHEALCRSFIFDVLTGLAEALDEGA